jgi:hypothetical protein
MTVPLYLGPSEKQLVASLGMVPYSEILGQAKSDF